MSSSRLSSTRVVETAELLENILGQLSDYDANRLSRATLANLAITCKDISERALNVLWRHQTNLFPLFRLLPDDLWFVQREHVTAGDHVPELDHWDEEEEDEEEERDLNPENDDETIHVIKLKRSITQQDTLRFDHYRTKILKLQSYTSRGYVYILHPTVLKALQERYRHLLPNVQEIQLELAHCYAEESTSCIQVLLGPKINSIFIISDIWLQSRESGSLLLSLIEKYATNTTSVGWTSLRFQHPSFNSLLQKLRGLRTLVCQGLELTYDDILVLGELPSLEHLGELNLKPTEGERRVTASQNLFLRLQSFQGCIDEWSQLGWFLNPKQISLNRLDVLRTSMFRSRGQSNSKSDMSSLNAIITKIGTYPNLPQTLTHFSMQDSNLGGEEEGDQERWNSVDFTPLNALSSLVSVTIFAPCAFFLNDCWIQRASECWPNLESLCIIPPRNLPDVVPELTLGGLVSLLRNCRNLSSLKFSAVWEPFDLLPAIQDAAYNTNITTLSHSFSCMGPHQYGQAANLYHCLMTLFPRLQKLTNRSPSGEVAIWDELQNLVNGPPAPREDRGDGKDHLRYLFQSMMATQAQTRRHKEIN